MTRLRLDAARRHAAPVRRSRESTEPDADALFLRSWIAHHAGLYVDLLKTIASAPQGPGPRLTSRR